MGKKTKKNAEYVPYHRIAKKRLVVIVKKKIKKIIIINNKEKWCAEGESRSGGRDFYRALYVRRNSETGADQLGTEKKHEAPSRNGAASHCPSVPRTLSTMSRSALVDSRAID